MRTRGEQLRAIFGADADLLANGLDVAARQHRAYVETWLTPGPDGLMTTSGAAARAAGHRNAAERCERVAEMLRDALADTPTDDQRHPAGGGR